MKTISTLVIVGALSLALAAIYPAHAEVNAAQAQALMKANKCGRCHAPDKTKSGPSLKKIAADLKGKEDAEAHIITQITTGPKVKLKDGSEEDHTVIKVRDQDKLKNLAQWILAQ
jgi:cytochrome c